MNNDKNKVYIVSASATCSVPHHNFVFLDYAAAAAKFHEFVEAEQAKDRSFDFITFRAVEPGADEVYHGADVMWWNPDRREVSIRS